MLTVGVDAVDADLGLWLPISEIARQKGVSKQAVAKKVDRLLALNVLETRSGPQNAKLVNLAAYDRAVGETTDAIRAANGTSAQAAEKDSANPVLAQQQARRASYEADLAQLRLAEKRRELLPVADFTQALDAYSDIVLAALEKLPTFAETLAAGVADGGINGARAALKAIVVDLRKAVAAALVAAVPEPQGSE